MKGLFSGPGYWKSDLEKERVRWNILCLFDSFLYFLYDMPTLRKDGSAILPPTDA